MDGFISVAELQLFCKEHKGMIGQSALDGQLILDIGDSDRGDAICQLTHHLKVMGLRLPCSSLADSYILSV